jgi:hypothetical protein
LRDLPVGETSRHEVGDRALGVSETGETQRRPICTALSVLETRDDAHSDAAAEDRRRAVRRIRDRGDALQLSVLCF